jgi:3'-phosphoadenosine 5'-phosphosulfate sulfotransferase (PAPS reductase)/FAD synthetase
MKRFEVINYSGGVDSTALILYLWERGRRIDLIVRWSSEAWDWPFLHIIDEQIRKLTGHRVKIIKPKIDLTDEMLYYEYKKGKQKGRLGRGWPSRRIRWCVSSKSKPLLDFLKDYKDRIIWLNVGYTIEEKHRHFNTPKWLAWRAPLVKAKWNKEKCFAICKRYGIDFNGHYDHFKRLSCWCCPLQSPKELFFLFYYHPDLWERLLEMDRKVFHLEKGVVKSFCYGKSVLYFDNKFKRALSVSKWRKETQKTI